MRTTVNINDHLLEQAKQRARTEAKSLGDFLEDALRTHLMSPPRQKNPPIRISTRSGGFRPGIDPTSNRSMLDAVDEQDDAEHADSFRP